MSLWTHIGELATLHAGFTMQADLLRKPYLLHLESAGYSLVFCVHCLGGAVAKVAAVKLLVQTLPTGRNLTSGVNPLLCITVDAMLGEFSPRQYLHYLIAHERNCTHCTHSPHAHASMQCSSRNLLGFLTGHTLNALPILCTSTT